MFIYEKNIENYLLKKLFWMENSVEGKSCINRESNSLHKTFSYTYVIMNMKLLEVVTPLSIYQLC